MTRTLSTAKRSAPAQPTRRSVLTATAALATTWALPVAAQASVQAADRGATDLYFPTGQMMR